MPTPPITAATTLNAPIRKKCPEALHEPDYYVSATHEPRNANTTRIARARAPKASWCPNEGDESI